MTMKAHAYYIIFGRPPIGGKLPPSSWRRHCLLLNSLSNLAILFSVISLTVTEGWEFVARLGSY